MNEQSRNKYKPLFSGASNSTDIWGWSIEGLDTFRHHAATHQQFKRWVGSRKVSPGEGLLPTQSILPGKVPETDRAWQLQPRIKESDRLSGCPLGAVPWDSRTGVF